MNVRRIPVRVWENGRRWTRPFYDERRSETRNLEFKSLWASHGFRCVKAALGWVEQVGHGISD